jgi:outer membrane biogenesis lipoprotein LolB
MKAFSPALVLFVLAGCSTSNDDPQSEAMISNAAAKLEQQADANVNRMISEIESSAESPQKSEAEPESEDKVGIEKQSDDGN